jgi:hypothetical protein
MPNSSAVHYNKVLLTLLDSSTVYQTKGGKFNYEMPQLLVDTEDYMAAFETKTVDGDISEGQDFMNTHISSIVLSKAAELK